MVDIGAIGGIPDPRPHESRPAGNRRRGHAEDVRGPAGDGLALSPEARRAAEALRFAEFARAEPDVREDRVQAARDRLASGDLDQPEVVRQAVTRLLDELA